MEKIQLETIKKILKKHLPKKKGKEIGDLAEGLHKWLHMNKNYKKVEKIVKDGCSKQKGGGKTRKRKRKRKKRTRSRRGGNGDFFGEIALPIMVGFGMYLLFEYFPPNNPWQRFVDEEERERQREIHDTSRFYYDSDEETKESAEGARDFDIFH